MKTNIHSKIVKRLSLSFFVLISLFLACGLYFLSNTDKLVTLTQTLYDHPLVVSNTSLRADVAIMTMHRDIKHMLVIESPLDIDMWEKKINGHEKAIFESLDIVKKIILGEKGQALEKETRQMVLEWRPIRERIFESIRVGNRDDAVKISTTLGTAHAEKLEKQMDVLNRYALNKASGFMKETEKIEKKILLQTVSLLLFGTIFSLIIAWFTIRKINRIERELRNEKNRITITLRSIGDGVIATDEKGRITLLNETAGKLTGWNENDALGKPLETVFNIINEFTREPVANPVSKVFETGSIQGLANHTLLISKEGKEFTINDSAAPIKDANNALLGVILVFRDVTHEQLGMKALHESQSILKAAFDNSHAGIAIADAPSGKLRYVNQAGLMIRGKSPEEIVNNIDIEKYVASWRILHFDGTPLKPDDVPLARAILYGETSSRELIIRRDNYEDRYVMANASPVWDEKGDVIAGVVVFMDITDRVQNEKERRLNEARLEINFQIAGMHDANEKEIANFVLEKMLPLSESDLGFIGFITPDEKKMIIHTWSNAAIEKCAIHDKPIEFPIDQAGVWGEPVRSRKPLIINNYHEFHPAKKGYPEGHVEIKRFCCVPVFDLDKIVLVAAVGNKCLPYEESDVRQLSLLLESMWTEIQKKRAALTIIESEEKWRSLAKSSPDHILLIDKNFNIQFANSASIGHSIPQLIGQSVVSHIEKNRQEEIRKILETVLETGDPASYETSHINAQNQLSYYDTRVVARKISGEIIGLTLSARDITGQKQAENQKALLEVKLRQAQKMEAIGTLSGGIAHDFNNILSIILGNAELAMEDDFSGEKKKSYLNEIITAGLRARDMVKQILNFSRKSELEKEPVDISQLVVESLRLIRASIPSAITINQNIPFIPTVVMANPTQINQIILNLCINAAHAMNDEGTLTVSLEPFFLEKERAEGQSQGLPSGNYVRLSVADTGCGIPDEISEKVFDPYFTTKEVGKGTGMGLSVVYGIVKDHQGAIFFNSETGKGTRFHVLFPVMDKEIQKNEAASKPVPGGTERILYVDDEEMIARMAKKMLSSLGYVIDCFNDPEEAILEFKKNPSIYDLVVTDMTMPGISGVTLAAEISKTRPGIPIILSTGYSDKINEEKARKMGIRKLLLKPVIKSVFAEAIREVLDAQS